MKKVMGNRKESRQLACNEKNYETPRFGSIFWQVAPLGQPMYSLHYRISSHLTFSNGLAVVQWPKQPDGWGAHLTVQNATNFPPTSEVLFTGPPGSLISSKPPDAGYGSGYKGYYQVSGPSAAPPAGVWQVQYGTNTLTFLMADPQVSSRSLLAEKCRGYPGRWSLCRRPILG
jgi:hypothetical protein